MGIFSGPSSSTPPAPPPPPPAAIPPTMANPQVGQSGAAQKGRNAAPRGGTIKTGGQGDLTMPATAQNELLGV